MKKYMTLIILALLAAAGYYCYQEGFMKKVSVAVEQNLNEICDPAKEDCSDFEADLEV